MALQRFVWTWQWQATKSAFYLLVPDSQADLLKKIEDEVKAKLKASTEFKLAAIESIAHSNVKYESVAFLGLKFTGTTTTTFTVEGSPLIPLAIVAAYIVTKVLPLVVTALIAWFVLQSLITVSSTIKYVGEVAPEALTAASIAIPLAAGGGVIICLVLLLREWRKRR